MVTLGCAVSEQTEDVSKVMDEMEVFNVAEDLTRIIETAGALILCLGDKLEIQEWNLTTAGMLGYSKDEAMGKHFLSFVEPEDRACVQEVLQKALAGKPSENFRLLLRSQSKKQYVVWLNVTPHLNSLGQIIGIVAIGQDMTEHDSIVTHLRNYRNLSARCGIAAWSWSAALGFDNSGLVHALYGVELEKHLEAHQRAKMLQFTLDIESRAKVLSNGDCFDVEISWTEGFEGDRWFAVHGVDDNGFVVGCLQEIQSRTVEATTHKWRQLANAGFDLSLRVDITDGVIVDCCGSMLSTIGNPQDFLFAKLIGLDEMQSFEDKCASGVETWSTNLPISIVVEGHRKTVSTQCFFLCDNLFTQKCDVYVKLMHPSDLPQSSMAGVSSERLAQYSIEPKPMLKSASKSGSGSTRGSESGLSAAALLAHNSAKSVVTDELVHKVWSDPSVTSQCHDTLDSWSSDDPLGLSEVQPDLEAKDSWGNQKCGKLQLQPPSSLPPVSKCLARGDRFKEHVQKVPLQGQYGASPASAGIAATGPKTLGATTPSSTMPPMGHAPHPQLMPLPQAWPWTAPRAQSLGGVSPVSRPGESKHYPAPLKVGLQKDAGIGPVAVAPATGLKTAPSIEDSTSTSLMLKNIPNDYTREMVLDLLHTEGFAWSYNFVFLPWDFRREAALGYVFVNMVDHHTAIRAKIHFEGFVRWKVLGSQKVCEVCWTEPAQDLQALIERYRNAPVMHENVPEKYKPLLYKNGERVNFPLPTKPIKPPFKKKYCAEDLG